MLLASGYLKVLDYEREEELDDGREPLYDLVLTNFEVKRMFNRMVHGWFKMAEADYNDFVKALLNPEPERFYHGFALGLMVELQGRYSITSNRESGFGRYDVILEPKKMMEDNAVILEFKVHNPRKEASIEDTVQEALAQIDKKRYDVALLEHGIPENRIRKYGFAFQGKNVLIG